MTHSLIAQNARPVESAPGPIESSSGNKTEGPAESTGNQPDRGFDRRNGGHGMLEAGRIASRWTVALRHIIVKLINLLPGCHLKSRLLSRLLGIRMGENVGIAYGCYLDPYAPSMISFGENVIVGFETRIFVHAFTLTRQRVRPVTIGSNVMIGGFCVIAPGVTIGDNASIAPGTIVSRDVPPGALVIGNQMRIRKRGE
ncbi:MAG: acyltransferase [Phycisphaerales bacterium]|nr:MAG: acyltransferase [Phycisphaerales bacterium]